MYHPTNQQQLSKHSKEVRMVLAEFSMFPTDKGESVSPYVAKVLNIVDRSGIPYQLTAMGTLLEGKWEEVIGVISKCFNALRRESNRIYVVVKIDYRKGQTHRMGAKVSAVEKQLGRKLRT